MNDSGAVGTAGGSVMVNCISDAVPLVGQLSFSLMPNHVFELSDGLGIQRSSGATFDLGSPKSPASQ